MVIAVIADCGSAAAATPTAAVAHVPQCPPDCGAVAAGDPLLVPFVTPNPGLGWQAFPAADSQSYVDSLRKNVNRLAGGSANVNIAAARWEWETHRYSLLITLVASPSLSVIHLQNPAGDATDECSSSGGVPIGSPRPIPGIPGSVSGSCAFRPTSSVKGAVVASFIQGNVAVLIEVSSQSQATIDPLIAVLPAQQQFASLPPEGVPVSSGALDVEWVLVWLGMLAAVVVCIVLCIRRRQSWSGPFVAVVEAVERRRVALGVSVAAVVGAMCLLHARLDRHARFR